MTRTATEKQYNNFGKGLVTDASPLSQPENSFKDGKNFEVQLDGSLKKRRGLEQGTSVSETDSNWTSGENIFDGTAAFAWTSPSGNAGTTINVVKINSFVYFSKQSNSSVYDAALSGGTIFSSGNSGSVIDLTGFAAASWTDSEIRSSTIDFDNGKGFLFIVGEYIEPIYVTYDSASNEITANSYIIEERDVFGVDDGLAIATNPSTLSSEHLYNLANQGWPTSPTNRITSYRSQAGEYPSNVEIWHIGKFVNPSTGADTWSASNVRAIDFGNTPAPRGRFIRNVFDTNQTFSLQDVRVPQTVSYSTSPDQLTFTLDEDHGISVGSGDTITFQDTVINYTGSGALANLDGESYTEGTDLDVSAGSATIIIDRTLPGYSSGSSFNSAGYVEVGTISTPSGETIDKRPKAVAFFAGRAWYTGIDAYRTTSDVFFTQILKDENFIGRCYQEADPTAEEINDLVATDGGVVRIAEMDSGEALLPVSDSMVVWARNGVWIISGGAAGFVATDYQVRNVLKETFRSPKSIVLADGLPFFWTDRNIYALKQDDVTGYLSGVNISQGTIQDVVDDVPVECLPYVSGEYNPDSKVITWAYSTDASNPQKKDTFLHFDLINKGFYKYETTVDSSSPYVTEPIQWIDSDTKNTRIQWLTYVTDDNAGTFSYSFSTFTDADMVDWGSNDYEGTVLTHPELVSDILRTKTPTWLFSYFNRTEQNWVSDGSGGLELDQPSSCKAQAKFQWTSSGDTGKWTTEQEAYRLKRLYIAPGSAGPFEYGYDVISTKLKMRGNGTSFSVYYRSPAGYDTHLLGYAIPITANQVA